MAAVAAGAASAEPVSVELNKLEAADGACQAYMVTDNNRESAMESLKLDLVMFDQDGIIAKRLAVELGPLPAGKTRVKVFRIDGVGCPTISRILVNDILSCGGADNCLPLLSVASRSEVAFTQ
jgi:hypothetical protein